MKQVIRLMSMAIVIFILMPSGVSAQAENQNLVHVQRNKLKWPENGTPKERDSLVAIYNNNVVKKNDKILSHREMAHFFTSSSADYLVIEEFKNFAAMEESFKMTEELEKKAWPDEKKRKEFMDKMNSYFERWHSDEVYHINADLTK